MHAHTHACIHTHTHTHTQSLIELICNVKAMEDMVVEMKYDAKKAPLGEFIYLPPTPPHTHTQTHMYARPHLHTQHTGKLTTEQIRSGYVALKKIEDCINKSDFGDRLYKACDEFYTRIPHCFG